MQHSALARYHRPKRFSDVRGHEATTKALIYALQQERKHQVFLFTGLRGIGKTTCARILAMAFNCLDPQKGEPCLTCASCVSILEEKAFDLFEIDAASKTKVDDTKDLLSHADYPPRLLPYKVFIIDEVHMLSQHSFNALLKTLEEPAEYLVFILATTNPEKIPETVRSRCMSFHLKPANKEAIEQHLKSILDQLQKKADPQALKAIASQASGSYRDALNLLEKALMTSQGETIDPSHVRDIHGLFDDEPVQALLNSITQQDHHAFLHSLDNLTSGPFHADALLIQLMACVYSQITNHPKGIYFTFYDILQSAYAGLKQTHDERMHVEIHCHKLYHVASHGMHLFHGLIQSDSNTKETNELDKTNSVRPKTTGVCSLILDRATIQKTEHEVLIRINAAIKPMLTTRHQATIEALYRDQLDLGVRFEYDA